MHRAEGIMDTVSNSHNQMSPSIASDTTACRPLVGCSRSHAPSASSTVLICAGTPRGASHSSECSKRPHLPSALSTQAHRGSATKGAKPYHRPVMLNHGVRASFFPSPPTSAILHARHAIKEEHASLQRSHVDRLAVKRKPRRLVRNAHQWRRQPWREVRAGNYTHQRMRFV